MKIHLILFPGLGQQFYFDQLFLVFFFCSIFHMKECNSRSTTLYYVNGAFSNTQFSSPQYCLSGKLSFALVYHNNLRRCHRNRQLAPLLNFLFISLDRNNIRTDCVHTMLNRITDVIFLTWTNIKTLITIGVIRINKIFVW